MQPEYALRSRQIYQAVQAGGGLHLDDYVDVPANASGLTIIGPSGIGKTTNLLNILSLYPQVIIHPEPSVYQIVWLKIDCPHAGSLNGLCIDFFRAVDRLLGTLYFQKFAAKRHSEDYMLAQLAQIAHTQHLGVLVIDEMQNLAAARRSSSSLLNFLVKLDNIIGVPVIRVGTNEAFPLFQGNFRNARRGVGEGGVIWNRMENNREWKFFIEGMWEFQWTKEYVTLTEEISSALYDESQGIIDLVIKLYKLVQWRAIALGTEVITVDLIHQVSADGLHLVKPMLDAIRSGDKEWMIKYKDIAPLDTTEYRNKCLSFLETRDLEEVRRLARKQQSSTHISATLRHVIVELMNLDVSPNQVQYMTLLAKKGLATVDRWVYKQDLRRRFFSYYTREFLEALGIDVSEDNPLLFEVLQLFPRVFDPVMHLLMIRFLSHSLEKFLQNDFKYQPFGQGPWLCLNPACEHYLQPVVTKLVMLDKSEGEELYSYIEHPRGIFECDCGFKYSRRGADRTELDKYRFDRIESYGQLWEQKYLKCGEAQRQQFQDTAFKLSYSYDSLTPRNRLRKLEAFWQSLEY